MKGVCYPGETSESTTHTAFITHSSSPKITPPALTTALAVYTISPLWLLTQRPGEINTASLPQPFTYTPHSPLAAQPVAKQPIHPHQPQPKEKVMELPFTTVCFLSKPHGPQFTPQYSYQPSLSLSLNYIPKTPSRLLPPTLKK